MHGVIEAGKLRLLVLSSGAGAASRHEIGTGVIGGMLFATFLGLLLIPLFYVAVRLLLRRQAGPVTPQARVAGYTFFSACTHSQPSKQLHRQAGATVGGSPPRPRPADTTCCGERHSAPQVTRAAVTAKIVRIGQQIARAKGFAGPDVRLVVFPEYFLSGFPLKESWA